MLKRTQIRQMVSKHRAVCSCGQCGKDYVCDIYSAFKSRVGHICDECKTQVVSLTEVTQQSLLSVFVYNEYTGDLIYKNDSISGLQNTIAGYQHSQGYWSVSIGKDEYLVHRVVWMMKTGKWPVQIDHKNHNRMDNRWANLRELKQSRENQLNMGIRKNNSSGVQGVRVLPSGKFCAYIMVNRKQISLGSYETIEEATSARKNAEVRYGFHVNHGS